MTDIDDLLKLMEGVGKPKTSLPPEIEALAAAIGSAIKGLEVSLKFRMVTGGTEREVAFSVHEIHSEACRCFDCARRVDPKPEGV